MNLRHLGLDAGNPAVDAHGYGEGDEREDQHGEGDEMAQDKGSVHEESRAFFFPWSRAAFTRLSMSIVGDRRRSWTSTIVDCHDGTRTSTTVDERQGSSTDCRSSAIVDDRPRPSTIVVVDNDSTVVDDRRGSSTDRRSSVIVDDHPRSSTSVDDRPRSRTIVDDRFIEDREPSSTIVDDHRRSAPPTSEPLDINCFPTHLRMFWDVNEYVFF